MSKQKIIRVCLHGGFWIGLLALLNAPLLNLTWGPFTRDNGSWIISLIYGMAINAILFYCNAFFLIPRFLHYKKYRRFFIYSVLVLVGFTLLEVIIDVAYYFRIEQNEGALDGLDYKTLLTNELMIDMVVWMGSTFVINIFYWGMAFLYRLPKDWMRNERQKQQLIQDKLTAELDFLKAQINPHFLFNGINSIYHLIGSDDAAAKKVLLQFSDLLRYQLYECKAPLIPLKNELNYVENYILLEEVRKGEDATIICNLPKPSQLRNVNGQKIAPLLLTPFLENAFKHLSLYSKKEDNYVRIEIEIVNKSLNFSVKNTIDPAIKEIKNPNASGIGLENVKRRLAILYPNQHILDISETQDIFAVNLKIQLS